MLPATRRALSGELGATFKQVVETLDDAEQQQFSF
jgi:hypothetical protein